MLDPLIQDHLIENITCQRNTMVTRPQNNTELHDVKIRSTSVNISSHFRRIARKWIFRS